MYSWTQLCHTLKVFYKIVISSHEDHPPFTHDALQDGFLVQYLYLKNQDKMHVRSVAVTTGLLKGPFSWTALSLLYIPFFTVKDHMHIY